MRDVGGGARCVPASGREVGAGILEEWAPRLEEIGATVRLRLTVERVGGEVVRGYSAKCLLADGRMLAVEWSVDETVLARSGDPAALERAGLERMMGELERAARGEDDGR